MDVRLTKARAFELDPKKAYLIFLKTSAFTPEQAMQLKTKITEIGIKNSVVVLAEKNSYKVVEASQAEAKLKKQAINKVKVDAKRAKGEKSK